MTGTFKTYLYLILFGHGLFSQNLVPNGGFENILQCPPTILGGSGGITINYFAPPWIQPTLGTSDILNTCNYETSYIIQPRNGKGYAAISVCRPFGSSDEWTKEILKPCSHYDYREYIETKLLSPLVKDKYYYVSFFAHTILPLYTDQLSLYLSSNQIVNYSDPLNKTFLKASPQINNTSGRFLSDTSTWYEISAVYKALGGENYITIGNFKSDTATSTMNEYGDVMENTCVNNPRPHAFNAYYGIDDVTVMPCDTHQKYDYGTDTIFMCKHDTIEVLKPRIFDGTYVWQDGSKVSDYVVSASGVYSVKIITNSNCLIKDTLYKSYFVKKINFIKDTILCLDSLTNYLKKIDHQTIEDSLFYPATLGKTGTFYVPVKYDTCNSIEKHKVKVINCAITKPIPIDTNKNNPPGDTIIIEPPAKVCPNLEIPNIITPNGDGVNEEFVIKNIGECKWNLTIYNRWGTAVYSKDFYDNSWNAKGLADGLYYYQIFSTETTLSYKGWIQIVR